MSQRASATVVIGNEKGLHARAASQFTQIASRYDCRVVVSRDEVQVSGKSIMNLLLLAAAQGVSLNIETVGFGADECLAALVRLVESNFGEDS